MEARRALVGASRKIAVISDVRGNLAALEAVLCEIDRERPDEIVQLGNLVGDFGDSEECAALARDRRWVNLIGSAELAVIRPWRGAAARAHRRVFEQLSAATVRWLGSLPRSVRATHCGFLVEFTHGSTSRAEPGATSTGTERGAPPRVIASAGLIPAVVDGRDGVLRVSPGAAGGSAGEEGGASYAIIELGRGPRAFIRRAAFEPRLPHGLGLGEVSRISIPPRA